MSSAPSDLPSLSDELRGVNLGENLFEVGFLRDYFGEGIVFLMDSFGESNLRPYIEMFSNVSLNKPDPRDISFNSGSTLPSESPNLVKIG